MYVFVSMEEELVGWCDKIAKRSGRLVGGVF